MEKGLKTAAATVAERYVGWQELYVCGDKGMREIHYYLKKKDGGLDLAVVGKEKSLRHITYRLLLDSSLSSSSFVKLRSRREVIDWLHNFLPDSSSPVLPQTSDGSIDANGSDELGPEMMKGYQVQKLAQCTKEFQWLGSPSFCRKKRKHYEAFSRNGVKISVNEFVYVLAEEDKRLVAYLDDMYEDAKGNKMVVVRWFHKIDEVGIDLPHNFNDREIFFSLCLQDLSIECIDGSATVLSPEHYAKFLKAVKHTQSALFVCCRQYDNDELKPLDITQVKGYWKQEIVRYMFSRSSSRACEKSSLPNDSQKKGDASDVSGTKPRKRLRLSRDSKVDLQCANDVDANDMHGQDNVVCLNEKRNDVTKCGFTQGTDANESRKDANTETVSLCMAVGSAIEVLSQDSGLRGCWFRAVIIKKHKNKVKLRYDDIKDAENEATCLEEWVLASRIAARDEVGIRICGRTTIRPRLVHDCKMACALNVGTVVDAWWHDGWWEGIVIHKESDEKFRVYFPGEKREAFFCQSDLRPSQEWIGNTWKQLNEQPALAVSIISKLGVTETTNVKEPTSVVCKDKQPEHIMPKGDFSHGDSDHSRNLLLDSEQKASGSPIFDLSKDDFLSQLRWRTSKKRKRIYVPRVEPSGNKRSSPGRTKALENHQEFVVPRNLKAEKESCKTAKVDRDKCKYISDSILTSSAVPPLTSLVMSR
ncbi:hypothetical protein Cgig2_025158 [Carnegiea gigantea]|uniref:BAH domain-containing protein n=1 Tax=Carnegiea gigantea TaxID=171969 RepID=A0A9Q1KRA5_9CARY|nr:hypothetical protein Cgig2_025158 [Carnegiea gigantea]